MVLRWFLSTAVISRMKFIGGGRAGWVLGVGVGGKPKAGNTIHSEANSSIVSSVEHRKCHSQPGRRRQSLAAV